MFPSNDDDFRKVTLGTLGNGAAVELFDHELQKVLDNISDPNTDAKEKRKITLEVSFAPSDSRDFGNVSIKCSSKTAGLKTAASSVYLRREGKKHQAYEPKMVQPSLFPAGGPQPVPNGGAQ